MNTTHAKNLFVFINTEFFDNELSEPTFIKYKGMLCNRYWFFEDGIPEDGAYIEGTIYYKAKLKGKLFRDTIAHELIHHYQHSILDIGSVKNIDWHGDTFKPFADLMIAEGYEI
jgi:hypothetical protein